jgi:CheY-like chemotaxis protein
LLRILFEEMIQINDFAADENNSKCDFLSATSKTVYIDEDEIIMNCKNEEKSYNFVKVLSANLRRKPFQKCYGITIPIVPSKSEELPSDEIFPIQAKQRKILIIEENSIHRRSLLKLLQYKGHYCEAASNGIIGVNMVKATLLMETDDLYLRNYDFILLSLSVSSDGGLDFAREIRQCGYKGHIVGMTTDVWPEEIQELFQADATCIVMKPFKIDTFDLILEL